MSGEAARQLRELVRTEIEHGGYTQSELARELGITEKHVSQTLIGHCGLSVNLAERMLAACGRRLVFGTEPFAEEST